MCLIIDREGHRRQTAGHGIEEIPPDIQKELVEKGYDPKDFIYVPYVLIKAAARKTIEEFENSLKKYITEHYVRSHLPK